MNHQRPSQSRIAVFVFFYLLFFIFYPLFSFAAESSKAMVVTANSYATRAALEILERGGNAVDAAVAAQWVLNVTEPQGSGLGGGGLFLYYDKLSDRVFAFDGLSAAPGDVSPEMFLDENGKPLAPEERITGGLPVGVPATLKLLETVQQRFGTHRFSFSSLFDPAIKLARKGFPISKGLADDIDREKDRLQLFDVPARMFFDINRSPLPAGTILFQNELANTFEKIQKKGSRSFYEGELAREIAETVRKAWVRPGYLSIQDLTAYRVIERAPISNYYRGCKIFSLPPPCSGGAALLEALNILELQDMQTLGKSPKGLHWILEAQSLALEDQIRYLGDPAYSKNSMESLISKSWAKNRAESVREDFAKETPFARFRDPAFDSAHTTHLSIVDEQGNMVSYTSTLGRPFGSAVMVPGRGFFLNNALSDFEEIPWKRGSDPLKRIAAGVAPADLKPNAAEGDKRPRTSMTPVLAFRLGQPAFILGASGGSAIPGILLNVILNIVDFEMSLEEAVAAPRVVQKGANAEMESGLYHNDRLLGKLQKMGHSILQSSSSGNVQALLFDFMRSLKVGASDRRGEGEVAGY